MTNLTSSFSASWLRLSQCMRSTMPLPGHFTSRITWARLSSGAIDIAPVDKRAHVILDVKCPGSGMVERMHWDNLSQLTEKDEVKFVIKDRADYEWAGSIVAQYRLEARCAVLFGPVFGELEPSRMAEWILADRLPVRLQVQLHKYIWDPEARGV